MPKMSLYLVLSLLIIVAVTGIGVGYYFVPLYSEADNATTTQKVLEQPANAGHLDALIAHHEEMIKLTEELRAQANSPKALDDANELRVTLMKELDLFKSWREQLSNAQ